MELLYKILLEPFVEMAAAPDFFLQVIWEGLVSGVLYALIALGFVLIFRSSRIFNFAQGIMVVFAALSLVGLYALGIPAYVSLVLALAIMAGLAISVERLVLRHLCQSRGWPVPPRGRLMSLQRLIATPPDSVAEVHWANAEYAVSVRAWRGQLWWQVSDTVFEQGVRHRQGDTGCARSGRQPGEIPSFEWDAEARKAWRALGRGGEHVAFTSRQPGDVLRVAGRGRRDIKRLLQEAGIPPWQREQLRVARMHDGTVAGLWHPSRGWWLLATLTS